MEQEIEWLGKLTPGTDITTFSNKTVSDNVEIIQICGIDNDETLHDKLVILFIFY